MEAIRMFEVNANPPQIRSTKEIVLLFLCGILAIAVSPVAYMRVLDENWTLALVDAGFIGIMLLLFLFVYVSRRTRTAGILIALCFISAALMSALLLGASEVYWVFPALMVAFFMLDTRQATILSAGFVGCFLALVWNDLPAAQLARICLTLFTTVLLANAFSLTNRRQMDALLQVANVDPLTGAGNRRAQNGKLDNLLAIFNRNRTAASILLLDIDHFKRINDTHGHIVGDQVLCGITDCVRAATRSTETLYRYGGEEFVVVAEHTQLNAAVLLAERIRKQIEQNLFAMGVQITVSIGVADIHAADTRETWMKRADSALYAAKRGGRNQVVVAGAPRVAEANDSFRAGTQVGFAQEGAILTS